MADEMSLALVAIDPAGPLYGHEDARDLEPHFCRHLMAMTGEGLHSKADIACELAYRDALIESLIQPSGACVVPREMLQRWLERSSEDWHALDQEFGLGIDCIEDAGDAQHIREMRALLGEDAQ